MGQPYQGYYGVKKNQSIQLANKCKQCLNEKKQCLNEKTYLNMRSIIRSRFLNDERKILPIIFICNSFSNLKRDRNLCIPFNIGHFHWIKTSLKCMCSQTHALETYCTDQWSDSLQRLRAAERNTIAQSHGSLVAAETRKTHVFSDVLSMFME